MAKSPYSDRLLLEKVTHIYNALGRRVSKNVNDFVMPFDIIHDNGFKLRQKELFNMGTYEHKYKTMGYGEGGCWFYVDKPCVLVSCIPRFDTGSGNISLYKYSDSDSNLSEGDTQGTKELICKINGRYSGSTVNIGQVLEVGNYFLTLQAELRETWGNTSSGLIGNSVRYRGVIHNANTAGERLQIPSTSSFNIHGFSSLKFNNIPVTEASCTSGSVTSTNLTKFDLFETKTQTEENVNYVTFDILDVDGNVLLQDIKPGESLQDILVDEVKIRINFVRNSIDAESPIVERVYVAWLE